MPQITSIETQKKDKQRCNIYLDGAFYCGLKLEVAIKYRLKVGMELEKSQLDEIQLETEKAQAIDKALTHLSASLKTEKQMRDFLSGKGYTQGVIEHVIERLNYYNYLDDFAYCRAYINGVHGKGKMVLRLDLIKRGAKREAIDEVLDGYEDDGEECMLLLNKYLRGKEINKTNLYKGLKYLQSKGFGYDTAKTAVEKFGECDEDY